MNEAERRREFEKMLFGVQRSVRYHDRREALYARVSRLSTWLSAVTSTAAVGAMVRKDSTWGMVLAGVSAALSGASLVLGAGDMARKHLDLRRRFVALEGDLTTRASDSTDAALAEWAARRLKIEEDEPPILVTLNRLCHNEQVRAQGWGYVFKIGKCARWTAWFRSGADDRYPQVDVKTGSPYPLAPPPTQPMLPPATPSTPPA